jgi:hypothetical protein
LFGCSILDSVGVAATWGNGKLLVVAFVVFPHDGVGVALFSFSVNDVSAVDALDSEELFGDLVARSFLSRKHAVIGGLGLGLKVPCCCWCFHPNPFQRFGLRLDPVVCLWKNNLPLYDF